MGSAIEIVVLSPEEVATLLGVTREDAVGYRPGLWRVPAKFVNARYFHGAAADLTVEEVCAWFGLSRRTVTRFLAEGSMPRLSFRVAICSGRAHKMIAPANAIFFFQERNRLAGGTVQVKETRGNRTRRAQKAIERARELVGD